MKNYKLLMMRELMKNKIWKKYLIENKWMLEFMKKI